MRVNVPTAYFFHFQVSKLEPFLMSGLTAVVCSKITQPLTRACAHITSSHIDRPQARTMLACFPLHDDVICEPSY